MREIKFRAWEQDVKFMNYSVKVIANPFGSKVTYFEVIDSTNWKDIPKENVMQLVSNKDITGVGVFDRDIITFENNKGIYFVVFDDDREEYVACDINYFDKDLEKAPKISRYWWRTQGIGLPIVLGNIYENPELLETKKSS